MDVCHVFEDVLCPTDILDEYVMQQQHPPPSSLKRIHHVCHMHAHMLTG